MPQATFYVPGRFDPTYSLLGRAVTARGGDRLRSEAVFVAAAVLILLMLVFVQYGSWALLAGIVGDSAGMKIFFAVQVAVAVGYIGTCLIGFAPAIEFRVDSDTITVLQGKRSAAIAASELNRVVEISPLVHHRHYRRYRNTLSFVAGARGPLLLLDGDGCPIVVQVQSQDLADAKRALISKAGVRVGLDSVAA